MERDQQRGWLLLPALLHQLILMHHRAASSRLVALLAHSGYVGQQAAVPNTQGSKLLVLNTPCAAEG